METIIVKILDKKFKVSEILENQLATPGKNFIYGLRKLAHYSKIVFRIGNNK